MINRKRLITYISLIGFAVLSAGAKELKVRPGNLHEAVESLSADDQTLKLTGSIDARDFKTLSTLPATVSSLDMSGLSVIGCNLLSPSQSGRTRYDSGELDEYLFFQSPLAEVSLPSNLRYIPEGLFAASQVRKVTVPSGCNAIGDYAFYGCEHLSEVEMPKNPVVFGSFSFADCKLLKTLDVPDGSRLSGSEIFRGYGVESLDLSNVKEIGDYALSGAFSLRNVILNENADYGEGVLLYSRELQNVSGVPSDLPPLFASSINTLKILPVVDAAETIGDYAFASTWMSAIRILPSLRYIGHGAFLNCSSLVSIDAFTAGESLPEVEDDAFEGIDYDKAVLYVTPQSYEIWKSHPVWGRFNIVAGESGVDTPLITDSGIQISSEGHSLRITAKPRVGNFSIYSTEGIMLNKGSSFENEVLIDCSQWINKIVVVAVENEKGSKTATILLKSK